MGGYRTRIGHEPDRRYFRREICTSRLLPKHTKRMRISCCPAKVMHLLSACHYRAKNSPLQPNKINYFPLYFGEAK